MCFFVCTFIDTSRAAQAAAPDWFRWDQAGWDPLVVLGLAASVFGVTLAGVAAYSKVVYPAHPIILLILQ